MALPSREEQQRISSFLKQLDSLIALHQRKPKYISKLT
ncbi:restriction endonuclease subunit S [Ligilactobacillus salivarius]